MASFLSEISNVGSNIATYSKAAWDILLNEAAADIAGLTDFYALGTKKVSILNNNFTYISASTNVVNNQSTPDDFQGRADFTYYSSTDDPTNKRVSKPLLVDPKDDAREDIQDNFKPKIDSSDGNATYNSFNGAKTNFIYNEHQLDDTPMSGDVGAQKGVLEFTDYDSIVNTQNATLVGKTNRWMHGLIKDKRDEYITKRFKTVISRFHTSNSTSDIDDIENSVGNSAYSKKYGLSHGRNLLKTNIDPVNPYDNPYCRVWTYHHQYNSFVRDTMRPLSGHTLGDLDDSDTYWKAMRSAAYGTNFPSGGKRLQQFGAMFDNNGDTTGLVNITPKWDADHGGVNGNDGVSLKHCMFSIENLAWKGLFNNYDTQMEEYGLSNEQKGPFGGRIMWFPPYDLKFSENSNAKWNQTEFIGRGEPIFTYSNTTRTGQLSFKLLIDHPSILDYWEKRDEAYDEKNSTVDDLNSKEQMMLRFFAGCEILKAKKPEEIVPEEPTPEPKSAVKTDKIFQFFVFYPNNYSGKDDKIGGTVDPIHYLMGGIGTQKRKNSDGSVTDFGVDLTTPIEYGTFEFGGYEIRSDEGIGVVKTETINDVITTVTQGSNSIVLAKMMSAATKKAWKNFDATWPLKKIREWHKKKYYYRADQDTLDQKLIGDANSGAVSYMDKTSYQFNSVGFEDAADFWSIKDKKNTYSLAEVFTVLEPAYASYSTPFCRPDELEQLKKIVSENKDRITAVHFKGRASSQQNNKSEALNIKRNKTLAKNRATTIRNWLKKTLGIDSDKFKPIEFTIDRTRDEKVQNDSNDREAKLNRFCLVEIHYSVDETEDASKTNVSITSAGTIDNNSKVISNDKSVSANTSSDTDKGNTKAAQKTAQQKNKRYDDEAKFFNKIQANDPFFYKLLSERVKFFNPAFHSVSPEGFNARLTFLNQCLRQGPTISMSDGNAKANNLSFGRPPVCILRIGDFYYTKIIIESLGISYDPLVWDLNEEGIGVMPMIADININFNFIGGSELAGPIQRLQNAISFNYYANASVYDNRAEITRYNENYNDTYQDQGNVLAFKPYFGPNTGLDN